MKTVYSIDGSGRFIAPVILDASDESPLEPGVYLIPAGAVDMPPPEVAGGQYQRWNGAEWVIETIPAPQPEPPQPTQAELRAAKLSEVRTKRKGILDILAGITLAAQLQGDTATTSAFLVVRQGLLDITADLPQDPDALETEVLTRYAAIVAQCTPEMISAFAQVVP